MLRIPSVALLALTLACSSTIAVQRPMSNAQSNELDGLLRSGEATLTYVTPAGETDKDVASDVTVKADKVQWTRWESEQARSRGAPAGQRVEAPIDAVRRISVCAAGCHSSGAIVGGLLGAGLGTLAAFIVSRTSGHHEIDLVTPFMWIVAPPLGGIIGALMGARGYPTLIQFEPPKP